jgi:hypothetical protein
MPRTDETQHRLLAWSSDSAAAERLAAQVLLGHRFQDVDPSHPYGGPDGGRDAVFKRNNDLWVMAVYFPRHKHPFSEIKAKFKSDLDGATKHHPKGIAFVTNQEITLAERDELTALAPDIEVEIFHMERVAAFLDQPSMGELRQKFGLHPRYSRWRSTQGRHVGSADIHQRIFRHYSVLPFSIPLPPFPMYQAFPGSEYYGGSAPSWTARQSMRPADAPGRMPGTTAGPRRFPCSL